MNTEAERTRVASYLPYLLSMISLTLETEPGAPIIYRRTMMEPHAFSARYRIETFPGRYARIMRQPRARLYDLESAEIRKVSEALSWGDGVGQLIAYAAESEEDDQYDQLDSDLKLNAGRSLEDVASSFQQLLDQLSTTEPPSATQLPYHADLGRIFAHVGTLAERFIRLRTADGLSEADATGRVLDGVLARGTGWHPAVANPYGIGMLSMALATTRVADGSELGLNHPAAPADGWLLWYQFILGRVQDWMREYDATLDPSVPMVTEPAGDTPPDPPGLADQRYRYAARFAAAYEGAPMTDTEQVPSMESWRIARAHGAVGLGWTDAYELLYRSVHRLLADARRSPGLLERVLGRASAGDGRDLAEALEAAMCWYIPRRHPYEMPNAPKLPLAGSSADIAKLHALHVLPMNRWEVRFRYPELLDLCSRLDAGSGTAGLEGALASFIAAREPCRVWLPPVVGELHEIVHLLPFDRDLGYAMAHLGADGSDGAAWRAALLQAADAITAHIWHHDDHPGTPGGG